jgi:hypothetical protein
VATPSNFEGSHAAPATASPRHLTARWIRGESYLDYDPTTRFRPAVRPSSFMVYENPNDVVFVIAHSRTEISSVANQMAFLPITIRYTIGADIKAQSARPAEVAPTIFEQPYLYNLRISEFIDLLATKSDPPSFFLFDVVEADFGRGLSIPDKNQEGKTHLPPLPAQSDRISELLDQYANNLEDGWLDERSKAPGKAAVERARKLYESARDNGYPPVRCYVSADGEVGLVWETGEGYGNVGFWADGSLVYYVRSADGREVRDDIVAVDGEKLPAGLIKALRTFNVGS